MRSTSRFLKTAAITTGAALAARSLPSWPFPAVDVSVVPPVSVFDYSQGQLLEGWFREQFENSPKGCLNLDQDGLLKPFRLGGDRVVLEIGMPLRIECGR
jgi:hypothetical protein